MIKKYGLFAVWVIATAATFGSLYFSEIVYIQPCLLSWFERICLYPLIIIAGQAAWNGDFRITSYLLPQTIIGLIVSLYHLMLQETSWVSHLETCAIKTDLGLGIISLPMLSSLAFLLINVLLILVRRSSRT